MPGMDRTQYLVSLTFFLKYPFVPESHSFARVSIKETDISNVL
jgi:hypothetical protein